MLPKIMNESRREHGNVTVPRRLQDFLFVSLQEGRPPLSCDWANWYRGGSMGGMSRSLDSDHDSDGKR